jgi:hypothetical protein
MSLQVDIFWGRYALRTIGLSDYAWSMLGDLIIELWYEHVR